MTGDHIICLVPMKPLATAKRRLRRVLDPRSRAALALLMLDHVLDAVAGGPDNRGDAGGRRRPLGARRRHSDAARRGSATPRPSTQPSNRRRATPIETARPPCSSCPPTWACVAPGDVDFIAGASEGLSRTVLAKAARDGGTNGLLAPQGMLPPLRFGRDSLPAHADLCRRAGIPCKTIDRPGLAFDLDTPYGLGIYRAARPSLDADLDRWRRRIPEDAFASTAEETPA